jgi:hypothetical protein
MIGGCLLVSVSQFSLVPFTVRLTESRALPTQTWDAQVPSGQSVGEEGPRGREDLYHSLVRLLFPSSLFFN